MNNIIDKLAESLTPFAAKLGNNRYLTVLRDAFHDCLRSFWYRLLFN
jgi:cellobiose-specific phosphotransferase system component IIC